MCNMEKDKEIVLKLVDWSSTCGDGCCYLSGTMLYFNGELLEHPNGYELDNNYLGEDVETSVLAVLKKLGYTNVKVERSQEYED